MEVRDSGEEGGVDMEETFGDLLHNKTLLICKTVLQSSNLLNKN